MLKHLASRIRLVQMPLYKNEKENIQLVEFPWIRKLVYLMDEQFRLPGTNFRFGLDPLINLFPFAGDISGFLISGGLVMAMVRRGIGSKIVVLMCINIFLDAVIGGIPLIGQVFDFFFKANSRNLRLMKAHYLEGKYQGSGRNTLILALIILTTMFAGLLWALWAMLSWFVHIF